MRQEDGTFATAPSEQYPGPMNRVFAKVSQDHILKTLPKSEHPSPQTNLHDFLSSLLGAFCVPVTPITLIKLSANMELTLRTRCQIPRY